MPEWKTLLGFALASSESPTPDKLSLGSYSDAEIALMEAARIRPSQIEGALIERFGYPEVNKETGAMEWKIDLQSLLDS